MVAHPVVNRSGFYSMVYRITRRNRTLPKEAQEELSYMTATKMN